MNNQTFKFKPMEEMDLPLLADWLSRPHLQKWWREEEITTEYIQNKYLPRITSPDDARPFIVSLHGKPIGYIQYYHAWTNPDWWPDQPGMGVLGIDQFIANEDDLNKGIGTAFISQFVQMLFDDPEIKEIRLDPRPDNLRAIHCYEKIGFRKEGEIITPDGPAIMMVLSKS